MFTNQDAINVIKSMPITILGFLAVTSITKYMKKPCKETADEVTMNVGAFLAKVSIDQGEEKDMLDSLEMQDAAERLFKTNPQ